MTLEQAVKEVYNWHWQYVDGDNFSSLLIHLFNKADSGNKARLTGAFPEIAEALELWRKAGDEGNDLFREYGLIN